MTPGDVSAATTLAGFGSTPRAPATGVIGGNAALDDVRFGSARLSRTNSNTTQLMQGRKATNQCVTRATALGSYTIPKVDVQVSGTLRSDPGGQLAANWTAPNTATVAFNHSPNAAFDDGVLGDGAALYAELALAELSQPAAG